MTKRTQTVRMFVTGQSSRRSPKRPSGNLRTRRPGFTLVELLVIIAIIALLVTILMPALSHAKQIAYMVRCRAHLHAVMVGYQAYASANDQYLPGQYAAADVNWYLAHGGTKPPEAGGSLHGYKTPAWGWLATIPTSTGLLARGGYVDSEEVWLCPCAYLEGPGDYYPGASKDLGPWTYHFTTNVRVMQTPEQPPNDGRVITGANGYPHGHRRLTSFGRPSETVVLAEENTGSISGTQVQVINDPCFREPDVTEARHLGHSQVGYLDAHADQVDSDVPLWSLDEFYCPPP